MLGMPWHIILSELANYPSTKRNFTKGSTWIWSVSLLCRNVQRPLTG